MSDVLSIEAVTGAISGGFGSFVRYFEEIASTNTEALDWAACGAPEGSIVVADHQTGGRGRWGRSWFSAPGKLLQFSLILRPNITPGRHGLLTAGLGVATARAIAATSGLETKVKWPNDVLVNGRKVAGMLVETTVMGSSIDAAVCGIGINVSLEEDDLPDELRTSASSIALEVERTGKGRVPTRAALLGSIADEVESRYPMMRGGDGAKLLTEATELSCVIGKEVTVRYADETTLDGTALGFDADGALRVESDGALVYVQVGEIAQLRT